MLTKFFFIEKYGSRAFQNRVDNVFMMHSRRDINLWSFGVFNEVLSFLGVFTGFLKVHKTDQKYKKSNDHIFVNFHFKNIVDTVLESSKVIFSIKKYLVNT